MTIDKNDRRTPAWFFRQCSDRFGPFNVDAAAVANNALCAAWFGPGSDYGADALAIEWGENVRVWCNCPYGPGGTIEKWIAKARRERDERRVKTLLLLPADTSTRWFQDVVRTELVELVPFRLSFEAPDGSTKGNSAKFGSVLVWIAPRITRVKATRQTSADEVEPDRAGADDAGRRLGDADLAPDAGPHLDADALPDGKPVLTAHGQVEELIGAPDEGDGVDGEVAGAGAHPGDGSTAPQTPAEVEAFWSDIGRPDDQETPFAG